MQPKERRETGEQDLFRSRLDQIIDLQHALVRLVRAIDWRFLEEKFGAVSYGQKIKTAAKMTVVQASTMEQLSAPFPTAPHGSA